MSKRYGIADIPNIDNKSVFFDANVIIYLFFTTTPLDPYPAKYSAAFKQLLINKFNLFINVTIISEIINSVLRIDHKRYSTNTKIQFKRYRNSQDGITKLHYIHDVLLGKVFPRFKIVGGSFSKSDLENILQETPGDFNDKLIAKICYRNDLMLLTNDKDFANSDLDIISCNPNIIPS